MRKADIISRISERSGIPKVDILVVLETFFTEVKDSLVEGEPVFVRGFGSFVLKDRAEKMGRNIKKNTTVKIPAHYLPTFKPSQEFMDAVKESAYNLAAHPVEKKETK